MGSTTKDTKNHEGNTAGIGRRLRGASCPSWFFSDTGGPRRGGRRHSVLWCFLGVPREWRRAVQHRGTLFAKCRTAPVSLVGGFRGCRRRGETPWNTFRETLHGRWERVRWLTVRVRRVGGRATSWNTFHETLHGRWERGRRLAARVRGVGGRATSWNTFHETLHGRRERGRRQTARGRRVRGRATTGNTFHETMHGRGATVRRQTARVRRVRGRAHSQNHLHAQLHRTGDQDRT